MTSCTCGRPVVPAIVAGVDAEAAEQRPNTRLCALCWRREFAWERVQNASAEYNRALSDYVLNAVPGNDVRLLVKLHHTKRAYQEACAAYEAVKGASRV